MYRIRLQTGEEAVYKTVEELAAAVTSGMISPTAEVFHKAGNRWLPINTHPDYRAVITAKRQALQAQQTKELQQAASSGTVAPEQPPAPVRAPTRKASPAIQFEVVAPATEIRPAQPPPSAPTVPVAKIDLIPAQPAAEPPLPIEPLETAPLIEEKASEPEPVTPAKLELAPVEDPFPDLAPEPEIVMIDPAAEPETMSPADIEAVLPPGVTRPRAPVVPIILGITGILVAAGLVAVFLSRVSSHKAPPLSASSDTGSTAPVAVVDSPSPVAPPPQAKPTAPVQPPNSSRLARADTVPVVYPAPSKPLTPASKSAPAAAQPPPNQPPRTVSRLGTSVNKMPSYYEAYADARAEMDESLSYVDFRRVFAPYRFASADSIRATRRMVAAAGNILRVYRGREVMLEQTYRPGEPEGKGSLREPFEVSEASRALLADVDSLFAILVSQEGEVKYRDNGLSFRNGRAAQVYSEMRRQIIQALNTLGDPAEAADRVTMPRLLRGFGGDRPPLAR